MTAAAGAALFDDVARMGASLPGYARRSVQVDMAQAVAAAIDGDGQLVVEAGTGTGKTLAYLLPALASGRKVIVSTATRYLQEQLADKDVPLARAIIGHAVQTSVLKGRSNYLCLYRLEQAEREGDLHQQQRLREIREWSQRTRSGDLGEVGDPSDGDSIWARVSSTTDNCLGRQCPFYEQCWVMEARRRAQQADLVIINHHLLFADLTLRERGFGELLPGADTVILDEAHKLPDTAGRFFGQAISGRQLRDFVRDVHLELESLGGDMPQQAAAMTALGTVESRFADTLAQRTRHSSQAWLAVADETCRQSRDDLAQQLTTVHELLAAVAERSEAMSGMLRRADELRQTLAAVGNVDADNVSWIEPRGRTGWVWHSTPLDVAAPFARAIETFPGAWIFTSATLAVDHSLEFFCRRMGLDDVQTHILASPFDYANNARLYAPQGMPRPGSKRYPEAVAEQVIELVSAAGGGAFVLCTSYRSVNHCADALTTAGLSPLVQGQGSRSALLDAFRASPDRILVGTSSFWEGVDVRGHGLRLVIIDKLPFAAPNDPVLAARSKAIEQAGGDKFMDYLLPQAVINLKQGAGRLIRDDHDRGLLAICDPRFCSAGYAVKFRNSLPAMPVTRSLQQACEFLSDLEPAT